MNPLGRRSFLGWLVVTGIELPKVLKGSTLLPAIQTATVKNTSGVSGPINVKDYGAIGDGKHNDTVAIQKALDAGAGQEVWLPPGTYLISRSLVIPANTTLFGSGLERSTILAAPGGVWKAPSPANWVFIVGTVNTDGVTVRDLTVNANRQVASGICILGGDGPQILRTRVQSASVHSGIHFFGKQTPSVKPVSNGLMLANQVENSTYNLVCDGQNENIRILGNISMDPGVTHYSLDGSQGGQGNFNIVLNGNQAVGSKGGASNTFLCYVNHGTVISGNSTQNSIAGRHGTQGQHFNIQESEDVVVADNNLYTSEPSDYPAWGVVMGASQVSGHGNVIDGVHTAFYLIGTSNPPSPFRETVVLNAKAFQSNNDPTASYAATYDLGGSYFNGERYHPKLKPAGLPVRSGAVYGNPYGLPITIYQPVHVNKRGTAGQIRVASGSSNPPQELYTRGVSSDTTADIPDIVVVSVPAAGYYQFTVTNASLGTPTIIGE